MSDLSGIRILLVQLKTDTENYAPALEGIYRNSVDATLYAMDQCNLGFAIESYVTTVELSTLLIERAKRMNSADFVGKKVADVNKQLLDKIEEMATENCGCKITKPLPEEE